LAGNIWPFAFHNFSDGSLFRAHLLQEVEVELFVWSSIVRRPGRSSAALRYPASLTVRPLLPVVAFADMRLTLPSPGIGELEA
jgi:hypothetical protein